MSCSSRCRLSDAFGKAILALREIRSLLPPPPPPPSEYVYWMLHDLGCRPLRLESNSTLATISEASNVVHLSKPSKYVAPNDLNAVILLVRAPLVSNTGSLSIPLATSNTLLAVSLLSLCDNSGSESSRAIDPILSSSSGIRAFTCLPTLPPMFRTLRIGVSFISWGIDRGYTTACPSGLPYEAPSLATVLLMDIPADSVKDSAS
mmetsp:Transcript_24262/g.50069  ORF Transcript_24262/g.50069 Transcript_24262/m.50069 type:complete len:205 (+) Transcript_24262:649-1263(+)